MVNSIESLILLPIFTILLVIIFRTIKDSLKFNAVGSLVLSICVSAIATIGLNSNTRETVEVILIPYATLAICIFLAVLIAFLFKTHRKAKDRFSNTLKKNPPAGIENSRKYKTDNDRIKR